MSNVSTLFRLRLFGFNHPKISTATCMLFCPLYIITCAGVVFYGVSRPKRDDREAFTNIIEPIAAAAILLLLGIGAAVFLVLTTQPFFNHHPFAVRNGIGGALYLGYLAITACAVYSNCTDEEGFESEYYSSFKRTE